MMIPKWPVLRVFNPLYSPFHWNDYNYTRHSRCNGDDIRINSASTPSSLFSFLSGGGVRFWLPWSQHWFIAVWIQDDGNRLRNWRSRNEIMSFRRGWQIQACHHLKTKTIAEISKKLDEADSNSQSSQSTSISANASPINNRSKKDKETEKDWYDSEEEDLKEDAKDREATMKRVVQTRAMLCPVCRWIKIP